MKSKRIIFFLFMFPLLNFAQGYNNLWLMGYGNYAPLPFGGTNIDFYTGTANAYFEPNRTMELCATVLSATDSLGQLLFYSNGAWIANKNHQLMLNGDSLNPSYYTNTRYILGLNLINSHIYVKMPGSNSLYYLFHQTFDVSMPPWTTKCYYSIIDMSADSGNGAVILKNNILLSDTLGIQMSACKHANGRDWWIILPEAYHPGYYIYLLTPDGISFSSKQTIGNRFIFKAGQATFSKDGSLYAMYDSMNDLEVFDFDRCTGTFSNPRYVAINDSMNATGVTISPNNRFIYGSSGLYLYQFDLQNLQNYQTIAVWDSFYDPIGPLFKTLFFTQELMPDNKVYITTGNGTRYLHVIDYPDSLGLACTVRQHGFQLPTINFNSTPYYPNVFLGPVVGSICDSLTVGITENKVQSASLRLNPNPATQQVWVNYNFPNNKDGWLEIYDTMGKLVLKRRLYWSTTQLLVYLNEIKCSGVFVARVYDDGGMFVSSERLVVIR